MSLQLPTYGGEYLHTDIFEMAAAYLFHIVKNHPFIDWNKRVGAVAALVFLAMNDLIWMDIRMPVMDGLEATHRIKSTDTTSHTKVIAITAHALEEDRMRIMQAGCDDFIRKPYRNAEIFDTLSRHLGVRFVYEEKPVTPPVEPEMELRPEQLAVLPSELLYSLHQTVIELDIDRTQLFIEQIREHNASIGNALKKLADKFDYDHLQKLLDAYVVSFRS